MSIYIGDKEIKNLYAGYTSISDMQGPSPSGFHVPSKDEWVALYGILTTTFSMASNATTLGTYLKMPMAGIRSNVNANVMYVGSYGCYWSSTPTTGNSYQAYDLYFSSSSISPQYSQGRVNGYSVRCFKNSPVIPTSSWTTLYQGTGSAGIFWNSTDGLISVSGDGVTWYTIMDKNLGATTVYNQGDTETDANCGNFYQWGNNYGFPHSGTVTISSTKVDASNYGPGNYYNSSTFITVNAIPYDRSSVQNDNLWGGVTQGTTEKGAAKEVRLGDTKVRPSIQPVNESFSYTGTDQTWTVPYTQDYIITCKGAGSNTSAGGLGQGTITLTKGTVLKIMVGQSGSSTSSGTYGFGGTSNYSSNRSGGGLSGVFTGSEAITATSSARALVIGGGAGGGKSSGQGGAGGGETGATGTGSYGTAGGGGTQSGHGSGGNAGTNQFNGGNGSGTYGYGGGGGWRGGNGSKGDGSGDDDKGGGGGSGYVISTASNRVLTQGGGSSSGNNGSVTIVSVYQG